MAYATGMRSKEIKQLQLGSIRLDSARPQVQVKRATTKTNKGVRFVALDSMACWALGKLMNRAHRLGACQPEHYLLPTLLDRHTRTSDPLKGGSGWDVGDRGSWSTRPGRPPSFPHPPHRLVHAQPQRQAATSLGALLEGDVLPFDPVTRFWSPGGSATTSASTWSTVT